MSTERAQSTFQSHAARARRRHHVTQTGLPNGPTLMFAHGYATNQGVWRHVAPAFEDRYHVVRFDHIGAGRSDRRAWDPERHANLYGFAEDVVELVQALGLRDVTFIGHSVSSMIGALAVGARPDLFRGLIMVGASARYLDDEGYVGGFTRPELEAVLDQIEADFAGWADAMAPVLAGEEASPEVAEELRDLFTETSDELSIGLARRFMLDDYRSELRHVPVPTLVMQGSRDPLVPMEVGRFLEQQLSDSRFVQLAATGHFPTLSAPAEVIAAIREFLAAEFDVA
jgi:sigma-B regulation protein RsbQ